MDMAAVIKNKFKTIETAESSLRVTRTIWVISLCIYQNKSLDVF